MATAQADMGETDAALETVQKGLGKDPSKLSPSFKIVWRGCSYGCGYAVSTGHYLLVGTRTSYVQSLPLDVWQLRVNRHFDLL